MKLITATTSEVSPKEMADALCSASPNDFQHFFLRMAEILLKDERKMMEFAEALAPEFGGNSKKVLRELVKRIAYIEGKAKYEPPLDEASKRSGK